MDAASSPLHVRRVLRTDLIINRLHMLFNGISILAVFHYRFATLSRIIETRDTPILPYLIVTISEIILTFLWILHQAYRWIPVARTAYPEHLPEDEKLPPIDVFVCTADPNKEPSLGVMNTVISAMALDYPSCKLSVYLSDDGGSHVTLDAVREAWKFARFWIPFCRNYELKIRCPESYFSSKESAEKFVGSSEFIEDRKTIEKRYDEFKEALDEISVNASGSVSKDHPPTIEVMTDENGDSNLKEMPLLVYVAREKSPGCPHHFKGGALNILLRVSALLSNAPYFLVLDCDMYCYDPTSARQAMCFFLDPKISPKLDRVQFLQKFRNISKYDIYDGRLNPIWREGQGLDGIKGPAIYGCNFFMTREAIYGTKKIRKDVDLNHLKKSFGSSNEFIKSLYESYKPQLPENRKPSDALQNELQLVASCTYDNSTEWGKELGYRYFSVVEDAITAIEMYCNGGISVQIDPERPCFLGASPTNLNDVLVQQTRWSFGLMQIGLSRFSPLIYCPLKMGVLQSMCFASFALDCLYTVPFYGLAIIPPICLLYGIPLYPKVSDPIFLVFVYILLSSLLKHVQEIFFFGDRDAFRTALYELRIWLMKCGACYSCALLNAILDKLGFLEANFTLTNKVVDDEQSKRHDQGIYDFQVSTPLLAPLCSVYFLNLACFIIGIARIFHNGDKLVGQLSLSLFAIVINYHFLEGMFLRKDNGSISPFVTRLSVAISAIILCCGSILILY